MKNIRAVSITLAVISMLLGGCAATPQASLQDDAAAKQFESAPGTAIVYLYRADYPSNVGFPVLWLDNRLIGELTPASYFRVSVRPGKNLLTAYAGSNSKHAAAKSILSPLPRTATAVPVPARSAA